MATQGNLAPDQPHPNSTTTEALTGQSALHNCHFSVFFFSVELQLIEISLN